MTDLADTVDLDAQIAALQAERAKKVAIAERVQRQKEKEDAKVLIGSTPVKTATKERAEREKILAQLPKRPIQPNFNIAGPSKPRSTIPKVAQSLPSIPAPAPASKFSSSLAGLRHTSTSKSTGLAGTGKAQIPRSNCFAKRPKLVNKKEASPELKIDSAGRRDQDDLTVLEELKTGPADFGRDPDGEEIWEFLEPNSGIRLSKRTLSHLAVQEHLSGRYYLTPSRLYSVIRLSRDGATYDVPVEGDWVTIAVVAERGEVRVSGTKGGARHGDASDDEEEGEGGEAQVKKVIKSGSGPAKAKDEEKQKWKNKRGPRKYINLKLCALSPRTPGSSSKTIAGDAMLQLLLFESDAVISSDPTDEDEDDGKVKKSYRGGSGGAYEKWCNLGIGSVIAILNPRVLRPLQSGSQAPHPLTLPLALNPTSGEGISVIGKARDLGCCSAQQKDGKRCKTWVDLRQGQVCEYHVHAAVQRGRAGRAEFTASTASYSLTSRPNATGSSSKPNFQKKTGLLTAAGPQSAPRGSENGGGGATYLIQGSAIRTSSTTPGAFRGLGDEHISEKLGRGRMEKRKRRIEEKEAEQMLEKLLEKDGGGGGGSTGGKYLAALGKSMNRGKTEKGGGEGKQEEEEENRKRPFSAGAIKRIGFDPSSKVGQRDIGDKTSRSAAIESLRNGERAVRLGRPKGTSKSNVRAPPAEAVLPGVGEEKSAEVHEAEDEDDMIDLD